LAAGLEVSGASAQKVRLTKLSRRAATLLSSFFIQLPLNLLTSTLASSIVKKLRLKNQAQTSQPVPLING
jgi:hypothetical protein